MAIRLDNLLLDLRFSIVFTSRSRSPPREPMKLGKTQLTPAECQHRREEGLCYYCGQGPHHPASCPAKSGPKTIPVAHQKYTHCESSQVSTAPFIFKTSFHVKAVITHSGGSHVFSALIDFRVHRILHRATSYANQQPDFI